MGRIHAFLLAALAIGLLALSACSSDHKKSETKTTTTTTASGSTTSTVSASTTTVSGSGSTTTSGVGDSTSQAVSISSFSAVGGNVVTCNAPTTIEMRWNVTGASDVEMHIDGNATPFTTYPSGVQDTFLPLACDGQAHTYQLVAKTSNANVKRSLLITTRAPR